MKDQIIQFGERIDKMELRQRILLLLAGLVLLFSVADTLAIQPALKQQKESKQTIRNIELKLDVLRERSGNISGGSGADSEYRTLLDTLADLERRIELQAGTLLDPEQAIVVLEQVLAEEQGLTLNKVSASIMSPEDSVDSDFSENESPQLSRYRVSLQLEGSYLATLRYLRALEELPWRFYWEGIDFEVIEHPTALVTLNIYTLGYPGESIL